MNCAVSFIKDCIIVVTVTLFISDYYELRSLFHQGLYYCSYCHFISDYYELPRPRYLGCNPGKRKGFISCYSNYTTVLFQEVRRLELETDHLYPSSTKVKNEWNYNCTPCMHFVVCVGTSLTFQHRRPYCNYLSQNP